MKDDVQQLDAIRAAFSNLYESAINEYFPAQDSISAAARYAALPPGKLLRPLLAIAAGDVCGTERSDSYRVAAAAEMIHAASLVHDDLPSVDNDTLRRGRPTCHVKFGAATAMYAGIALQSQALAMLAAPAEGRSQPAEIPLFWVRAFSGANGARGISGGQVLDLEFEGRDVAGDELIAMYQKKSAALFEATLTAGAIPGVYAAPHRDEVVMRFQQLGGDLGVGFQMLDDVLDAQGEEPGFGKTPGKDLAAAKATAVSLWGRAQARRHVEDRRALCLQTIAQIETVLSNPARLLRDVVERTFARLPQA